MVHLKLNIALSIASLLLATTSKQCSGFMQHQSPTISHQRGIINLSTSSPFTSALAQSSRSVGSDEEESMFDGFAGGATDLVILGLRIGTCSLMVHHGFDKIQNVDGFSANVVAKFFGFLPGNPAFWTLSAAATQVAGAGLLTVGVLSRPVALSMMATMLAAVVFHLLNTGVEGFPLAVVAQHSYNYELAAMYVCVLAYFSAAGAGAYSIDEQVLGGELKFYESLYNKVFGGEDE